jgi:hypothetical protein
VEVAHITAAINAAWSRASRARPHQVFPLASSPSFIMGIRPVFSAAPSAPPAFHIPRINRASTGFRAATLVAPILATPAAFRRRYGISSAERPEPVLPSSALQSAPLEEWSIPIDDAMPVRSVKVSPDLIYVLTSSSGQSRAEL